MQQLSLYLIKMLVCSAVLVGYYWIALRNERFHQWNRFYLLIALLLSILIPFLNISLVAEEEPEMIVTMVSAMPWNNVTITAGHSLLTWKNALWAIGGIVSLSLLFGIVLSVVKVVRLYRRHDHLDMEAIRLVLTGEKTAPFSFFNWLFWRRDIDPDSENGNRMLKHELVHIHEKHSADKLFTELVLIFFWMNPFFWIIRHELYALHEFLADRKAIDQHDGKAFAAMILQATHPGLSPTLTNPFFNSQLKRRLIMITTSPAPKYSYIRRISGLLLMIGIAFTLAFSIENATAQKPPPPPPAPAASEEKPLPDSITSISVNTPNGKAMVEYKMKDGRTLKMSVKEAEQQGYPVPDPPPPPPAPPASQIKPVDPMEPVAAQRTIRDTSNRLQLGGSNFDPKNPPLIIYAGLEITPAQMNQIDADQIESMTVLSKEQSATYGAKAKNGVIRIEPKRKGEIVVRGYGSKQNNVLSGPNPPKIIIDGILASQEEMEQLDPNEIQSMNVFKGATAMAKYGEDAKFGAIEITTKPAIIFAQAEFPGGQDAWKRHLQTSLRYPEKAQENGTQGVVHVQFLVAKDGSLSNVKPMDDPGDGLAEEAVRILKSGPKWKPALQDGKQVASIQTQTITFRLE